MYIEVLRRSTGLSIYGSVHWSAEEIVPSSLLSVPINRSCRFGGWLSMSAIIEKPSPSGCEKKASHIPNGGNGVFATQDYTIGSEICRERTEKSHDTSIDTRIADGKSIPTEFVGYLNHSCKANCEYKWHESTSMKSINVIRPTKADDELTVDYTAMDTNYIFDKALRKERLMRAFNFECVCEFCKISDQEDVKRRGMITDLYSKIPQVAMTNPQLALSYGEDILSLLKECELFVPAHVLPIYSDLQQICKYGLKDARKAKQYEDLLLNDTLVDTEQYTTKEKAPLTAAEQKAQEDAADAVMMELLALDDDEDNNQSGADTKSRKKNNKKSKKKK